MKYDNIQFLSLMDRTCLYTPNEFYKLVESSCNPYIKKHAPSIFDNKNKFSQWCLDRLRHMKKHGMVTISDRKGRTPYYARAY